MNYEKFIIGTLFLAISGCASLAEEFGPPRLVDMKNAPVGSRAYKCYYQYDCKMTSEVEAAEKERAIEKEEKRRQYAIEHSAPPPQEEEPKLPNGCSDIFKMPVFIVQKLDRNRYELSFDMVYANKRAILITKKAIFNTTGHPVGIGVERAGVTTVQLQNGFNGQVEVYRECAVIPYKTKDRYNPQVSFREEINGE